MRYRSAAHAPDSPRRWRLRGNDAAAPERLCGLLLRATPACFPTAERLGREDYRHRRRSRRRRGHRRSHPLLCARRQRREQARARRFVAAAKQKQEISSCRRPSSSRSGASRGGRVDGACSKRPSPAAWDKDTEGLPAIIAGLGAGRQPRPRAARRGDRRVSAPAADRARSTRCMKALGHHRRPKQAGRSLGPRAPPRPRGLRRGLHGVSHCIKWASITHLDGRPAFDPEMSRRWCRSTDLWPRVGDEDQRAAGSWPRARQRPRPEVGRHAQQARRRPGGGGALEAAVGLGKLGDDKSAAHRRPMDARGHRTDTAPRRARST